MVNSIVGKSKDQEKALALRDESNNLQGQLNRLFHKQLENHNERLTNLEDNMRINGIQEMNVKETGNIAVIKALDGVESNAYQDRKTRSKTYSAMWRRFKKQFGIPRYGELAAKDFDEAMVHLKNWKPDRELAIEIEHINNQTRLFPE